MVNKELWLIRHGESTANAGILSPYSSKTSLTAKGHQQAQQVADHFAVAPDLIVLSPFLRARQTAQPTIERFPHVKCEEWPVQEFTYLSTDQHRRMTALERNLRVFWYWKRRNPHGVDGEGAESFVQLFSRVEGLWTEWQRRDEKQIVVFCHSMFIYGFDLALRLDFKKPGPRTMKIFRELSSGIAVPNGGVFKYRMENNGEVWTNRP